MRLLISSHHVVPLPAVPASRRYLGEPDAKDAVVSTRHVLMRAAVTGEQHVGSHLDASTVEVETLGRYPGDLIVENAEGIVCRSIAIAILPLLVMRTSAFDRRGADLDLHAPTIADAVRCRKQNSRPDERSRATAGARGLVERRSKIRWLRRLAVDHLGPAKLRQLTDLHELEIAGISYEVRALGMRLQHATRQGDDKRYCSKWMITEWSPLMRHEPQPATDKRDEPIDRRLEPLR